MERCPRLLSSARDLTTTMRELPLMAIALFYLGILACIALYQLGMPGDFLLDDYARIVPLEVRSLDLRGIVEATLSHSSGVLGRHFSFFTFALTDATTGPHPAAYKQHNILLHALVACFQFWTLGRLLSTPRLSMYTSRPWLIASCITVVWALHPLLVSTVLYAVQRMTILATLFTWIALLLYVAGRTALDHSRIIAGSLALFVGVPSAIVLGCLSKENAVLIPLYLGLIEWFVFPKVPATRRAALMTHAARALLIGVPIILGAALFVTQHDRFLGGYDGRAFTLPERLATEAYAIWWYVRLIFLPLARDLSLYHDSFRIFGPENIAAWLAGLSLIALFVAGLATRKHIPLIGLGITMFLASHALESTIIPLELVFEHRNYFGASFLLLMAVGIWRHATNSVSEEIPLLRHLPAGLFVIACGMFGVQTGLRAWTWSDREMLTFTAVQEQPRSVRAHVELANFHLRNRQYDKALRVLGNTESLDRTDSGTSLHILLIHCPSGSIETSYERALNKLQTGRVTAYTIDALQDISRFLRERHCPSMRLDQYHALVQAAIENESSSLRSKYFLHDLLARTLADFGLIDIAAQHARRAMALSESAPVSYRHRAFAVYANLAVKLGRLDEARSALRELERLSDNPRISIDADVRFVRKLIHHAEQESPGPDS